MPSMSDVEAAADMFLNWVYRRVTYGAPDWVINGNPQSVCEGPLEGTWEGFRNIKDDNGDRLPELDNRLPGNTRYLWMDNLMNIVFDDNPNWTSNQ